MNKIYKGSCAFDKARYETVGHPQFTAVCHYRYIANYEQAARLEHLFVF